MDDNYFSSSESGHEGPWYNIDWVGWKLISGIWMKQVIGLGMDY